MASIKNKIHILAAILVLATCISSCIEEQSELPTGKLQLSIGQVSTDLQSRAAPSELPLPILQNFKIKVQRKNSELVTYEGKFVESIETSIGEYNVTATHGENVIIGRDTPFYSGTADARISKDEATEVTIPCRVANALVSVKFGVDEEERARFERFYSDFGVMVSNGDYAMSIGKDETATSIYFPAGTSPELIFFGTLKEDITRTVSVVLTHDDLPEVFAAADHAKLTITLPDPESVVVVNIGKVELSEARLDETIPLSWLPVPTVTPVHNFGTSNMLVGTDLNFSNAYPEMTWEARVSNSNGDTVRVVVGSGALVSDYKSSADWTYLSPGKYKATYFLHTDGEVAKVSSREFMVPAPQLAITFAGYTSHSLYEEGKIDEANAADGFTLYEPNVSVNISPTLLSSGKFDYKIEYAFDGAITSAEGNYVNIGNKTLAPRVEPYELSADITFDGTRVQSSTSFRITGIPFLFAPPTTATWQKNGKVNDEDGYARFGNMSDGSQTFRYQKVAIPAGTRLAFDYKFTTTGDVGNTFTIYAGEQVLVASEKISAWNSVTYESVDAVTISTMTTYINCVNSYGAGLSYTDLYRVGLSYRQ